MAFTADYDKFKFPENAFKGKRVLITGASKGIGAAAAEAFADSHNIRNHVEMLDAKHFAGSAKTRDHFVAN